MGIAILSPYLLKHIYIYIHGGLENTLSLCCEIMARELGKGVN